MSIYQKLQGAQVYRAVFGQNLGTLLYRTAFINKQEVGHLHLSRLLQNSPHRDQVSRK